MIPTFLPINNLADLKVGDEVTLWNNDFNYDNWQSENARYGFAVIVEIRHSGRSKIVLKHGGATGDYPDVKFNGFSFKKVQYPLAPAQNPATVTPMNISYIIARNGTINAFVGGKNYSLPKESDYYEAAKQALRDKNVDAFIKQCDLDSLLKDRSRGHISLVDGVILWNGNAVHNALTERIKVLIREDFPFEPLLKFLENTLKNPEERAVNELYEFLEKNVLPITEDGCFLAYRRVDENYMSMHANPDGTRNRNMPGDEVTMKRSDCDHNKDQTCSRGLHFCSTGYLPSYPGKKTVIVKIDPADVVSIPTDYQKQKGRCCRYVVVDEYLPNDNQDVLKESAVYEVVPPTEENPIGIKPSGQKYHAKRGADGRWAKRA